MKKKIVLLLLVVASVFALAGCGKDKKEEANKDPLIASWAHENYVYTFKEDKTGVYDAAGTEMKFTYEIKGNKLSILYDGNTAPFETEYKIEKNVLTIKDSFDNDVEYKKK